MPDGTPSYEGGTGTAALLLGWTAPGLGGFSSSPNADSTALLSVAVSTIEHMSEALAMEVEGPEDLSDSAVLRRLRAARAAEDAAAAEQLLLAATWADRHPPESMHDAAVFMVPGS